MPAEKPTPERLVVDFPKTEIADEKTRRVMTEATRLANLAPGEWRLRRARPARAAHTYSPGDGDLSRLPHESSAILSRGPVSI
jgi:hypothetical protein